MEHASSSVRRTDVVLVKEEGILLTSIDGGCSDGTKPTLFAIRKVTNVYLTTAWEPPDTEKPVKSTTACDNTVPEKAEYSGGGQAKARQCDITQDNRKNGAVSVPEMRQAVTT